MTIMFNAAREAQLRAFWPGKEPIRTLASEWGCTDSYVSQKAKWLGLPSRQGRVQELRRLGVMRKFGRRIEGRRYFEAEAAKRNLTPGALEHILINVISNDKLVGAILDDDVGQRAA